MTVALVADFTYVELKRSSWRILQLISVAHEIANIGASISASSIRHMKRSTSTRKKWSSPEIMRRQERAARLRAYRRNPSPSEARAGELSLVRAVVKSEFLADEPASDSKRWPEYGYKSALQCTELFCQLYLKLYREHYSRYEDSATAQDQKPVDPELLLNDDRQINGLWRARQCADQIGMPYGLFLRVAIDWGARQRNRKEFPAPNQLYGSQQIQEACETWEKEKASTPIFTVDWDDRLFVGDTSFDPARRNALQLAIERLKKAAHPQFMLANLIGRDGAMSETIARRIFRERPEIVDEALTRAVEPTKVRGNCVRPYVPGCFGLVNDESPVCPSCTLREMCTKLYRKTSEHLVSTMGSEDPRTARKRKLARNRKRRQRQRERDMEKSIDQKMEIS